ncbi:MAG: hypothetical protein HKO70_06075, partial [Acidimicrobiia bacterium]|nr:hypothetical protein [Acidimicrobiia bacterium]
MKKLITVLTIAASVVGVSAAPAAASANAPACPATGDYVVKLTHRQLLGWNDTENRLGPFPVEIPAGTYQLTLASYDDHSVKPGQGHTQPAEVWSLSFEGASSTRIASSAITPDLPADQDLAVFALGTIELGADAVQVVAEHGFFDAYNPNSVVPLCAALTAVAPATLGTTASLPAPVPPPAPSAASATIAAEPAPVSGSATASDPTAVA